MLEHDFTVTPDTVNSFRYAINRYAAPAGEITDGIAKYEAGPGGIGIGNTPPGEGTTSFPGVTFSGFSDAQSQWYGNSGYTQDETTYDIVDNCSRRTASTRPLMALSSSGLTSINLPTTQRPAHRRSLSAM